MFVLDTNTLIYYFKGMGQVASHLEITPPSKILIPTIVLFELYVGIEKSSNSSRRSQQLDKLLSQVQVLQFDQLMAQTAAAIRAQLEQIGQPIGPLDVLIAGAALAMNATLVTRNTREFGRIPTLLLVDWY